MADYGNSKGGKLGDKGAKHPKGDTGKLLNNGLNYQEPCTGSPADYGMDNKSDVKNQKPMSTPRKGVSEKGKKFTIC